MPPILTRRRFLLRAAATAGAIAVAAPWPSVAGEAALWGDLKGRFVYDGKPPERKRLKVDKDVTCCGKFDIRDESLMVGRDGGLANVFVYLRTRRVAVIARSLSKQAANEVTAGQSRLHLPAALHDDLAGQAGVPYRQLRSDRPERGVFAAGRRPGQHRADGRRGKNIEARWKFRRRQNGARRRSTATTIRGRARSASAGQSLRRYSGRRREVLHRQAAGGPLGISGVAREGRANSTRPGGPRADSPRRSSPGMNDLGTIKIAPRVLGKQKAAGGGR